MIVDAQLSQGNGVSAVDEILRSGFVPHLFITGDTKHVLAQKSDAVALEKPFREPELAQAIQRALESIDKTRAVGLSSD
jgi:FixJ family two-component response regulator